MWISSPTTFAPPLLSGRLHLPAGEGDVGEAVHDEGVLPEIVVPARVPGVDTLTALVSAGIGVSLVPGVVARAARAGVAFRPLAGKVPRLPLHVVWRAGDLPPTGKPFVAMVREVSGSTISAEPAA